ncbi:2368_t:CDS:2, partial [Scutellospora calospora]
MDVNSICFLPPPKKIPEFPTSNSSIEHVHSLPSPPIIEPSNEKGGPHLPPLTSILKDTTIPLPPSIQIPKPRQVLNPAAHNASITLNQHNNLLQSSTSMESLNKNENYPVFHEQVSARKPSTYHESSQGPMRRSSYDISPLPSSSNSYGSPAPVVPQRQVWQPVEHRHPYYYQQPLPPSAHSLPPPPYLYDQRQGTRIGHGLLALPQHSNYPQYGGSCLSRDDSESPYIQTTEPPFVKLGKVVDHCSQISQFASQYRDVRLNQGSWNSVMFQINETQLTNIINRAYDVLNILNGLKNEVTSRNSD